jgi:hypothetical protein
VRGPVPRSAATPVALRRWLSAAAAAHALATALIVPSELAMRRASGSGIVALELAGSPDRASQIMMGWGEAGRQAARRSLVVDFGYMLSYATFMLALVELTGVRLGGVGRRRMSAAAGFVGWGQVLGVACDAVEGFVLLQVLARRCTQGRTRLVRWVAVTKFGCVGAGLGYAGFGLASTFWAGTAEIGPIGSAGRVAGSARAD